MDRARGGTRGRLGTTLCVLGLAVLFGLQLAALVTHRVDFPLIDDWRYYQAGFRMPADLSLAWLFAPAKDTLHVSGKLLDWLIFRYGSHDYRVLAITSFVIGLGGWLVATVGLCVATTHERLGLRLVALSAFVLPLAASPYWVTVSPHQALEPAIAYHQMLPVLGLSALAWITVSGRTTGAWTLAAVVLVTLFFSLAYSSGALALFLFGGVALSAAWLRRGHEGREILRFALVVSATAGLCLVLHAAGSATASGSNPILETRAYEATHPFQRDFWQFFFALFDRAVLSSATGGGPTLRGAAVAAGFVTPFAGLTALLLAGRLPAGTARPTIAIVAVAGAILGYAALVTYGRASFGARYLGLLVPPGDRPSLYAHSRFFYWWITAALPITAVAWGLFLERLASRRVAVALTSGMLLLAFLPKQNGRDETSYWRSWRYDAVYQSDAKQVALRIHRVRTTGSRHNEAFVARSLGATFVSRWEMLNPKQPRGERRP